MRIYIEQIIPLCRHHYILSTTGFLRPAADKQYNPRGQSCFILTRAAPAPPLARAKSRARSSKTSAKQYDESGRRPPPPSAQRHSAGDSRAHTKSAPHTASRTRAHSRDAAEQSERARLGASPTRVDGVEATDPQTGLTRPTTPPATRFDPASVSRSSLDFSTSRRCSLPGPADKQDSL